MLVILTRYKPTDLMTHAIYHFLLSCTSVEVSDAVDLLMPLLMSVLLGGR